MPTEREDTAARRGAELPGLTGLRGVAVLMVVVGHVELTHGGGPLQRLGGFGVQVFFVLSGYLITTLLLRERDGGDGTVSLRRFYARRALRLLPPLYLFLGTVAILTAAGALRLSAAEVGAAALHVWNYSGFDAAPLNHVWSLNVEEHYYLAYPALVVLLARRRLAGLCAAAVLAGPVIRVVSHQVSGEAWGIALQQTHDRVDALLLGCLLALCWSTPVVARLARLAASPPAQLALPAAGLGVLVAQEELGPVFMATVGLSAQAALAAAVVAGLQHRRTATRRVLETRVLVRLGTVSYSLYLWQQLFTLPGLSPAWLHSVAVALAAPLVIAEVSWRVLEDPLGRVRRRLA